MKKLGLLLILALVLTGCQQASSGGDDTDDPVKGDSISINTTDGVRYVKNSLWEGCSLDFLTAKTSSRSMARSAAEISAADLANIVQTLNTTENETQYFVSEEDIPITESENCSVYIAKKIGHDILWSMLDFPRTELAALLPDVRIDAMVFGNGAEVYVDKVPPYVAPPVDDRPDYIKYAINIVKDSDGSLLLYENAMDHMPIDWTGTKELWFYQRQNDYRTDIMAGSLRGYHVEAGYLYEPPEPTAE